MAYLACAPTNHLQSEIPQVVLADFLGDDSAGGILAAGTATADVPSRYLP